MTNMKTLIICLTGAFELVAAIVAIYGLKANNKKHFYVALLAAFLLAFPLYLAIEYIPDSSGSGTIPATVHIRCVDENNNIIFEEDRTIDSNQTIFPPQIPQYQLQSSGTYVMVDTSTGHADPSTITFMYKREKLSATVDIYCYDDNNNLLQQYNETLSSSRTINPPQISGYQVQSVGQFVAVDTSTGNADPSTISFRYKKDEPQRLTATINIYCYDNESNTLLQHQNTTINSSRNINPPTINGYKSLSQSTWVNFDSATGYLDQQSVSFYYEKIKPVSSYTAPTKWDTKFKKGSSNQNPDGYNNLYKLTDDRSNTVFTYMLWTSDNDGAPEFTAYFNNSTVKGIKIRNGSGSDYWGNMRINTFYVKVYTNNGSYEEREMTIPDEDRGNSYYSIDFSKSYSNVTRIEIYITDRHVGTGKNSMYLVNIRDIGFY